MKELYSEKTIREIKSRYGIKNRKSLGQHFLTSKEVIDQIMEAAGLTPEDLVIEIGPGIGVLTVEEARLAKRVIAVELDEGLIPILQDNLRAFDNVRIINQDILKVDIDALLKEEGYHRAKVIGNLPYYITTPIIMALLESRIKAESITVMMQKEVADRITASPGGRTYGAITLAVNYYCETQEVALVPKEAFHPAPKVDSAVLKLIPRETPPVELKSEALFFACIKAGFGQRRKTLLNALTGAGYTKEVIKECLEARGIEPQRRAETLSIEDFAGIANWLWDRNQ